MTLCELLRNGKQADADGIEVTISRQAAEEAADEIERLTQRDRDYRDITSGCPDVLISRELLTKSFDKLYREKALRERVAELEGLCRQLYKAEETKHQQDWTAAIRALEKVGADSVALERPNAIGQGSAACGASPAPTGCAAG